MPNEDIICLIDSWLEFGWVVLRFYYTIALLAAGRTMIKSFSMIIEF